MLPEVTEEWPIKKIIEYFEDKLKNSSDNGQKVRYVTEETKVMLLEVAGVIREICIDKSFQSPLEILDFVQDLIDEE